MGLTIKSWCLATVGLALLTASTALAAGVEVDPAINPYKTVQGVSGNLVGVGSDTLNNMMDMWLKEFQRAYPSVSGSYRGEGSSTAPPALIEGTSQLGPMSRAMKPEEEDQFEKKHGYRPTQIIVALDCLAVFVNKDNPVKGLTMAQVDGIFSSTQNSGSPNITTWGQAGLQGNRAWAGLPISLYGRNSVSGTYAFFKEHALAKGDFKDTVKEQPGSAAVINGVANDRGAVGYSGIGYKTADVRVVPLAKKAGEPYADASFDNALKGTYPLGRALYIYVNKKPNEPLPPLVAEFIKFVLSREGQEIVVKDGFGPAAAGRCQAATWQDPVGEQACRVGRAQRAPTRIRQKIDGGARCTRPTPTIVPTDTYGPSQQGHAAARQAPGLGCALGDHARRNPCDRERDRRDLVVDLGDVSPVYRGGCHDSRRRAAARRSARGGCFAVGGRSRRTRACARGGLAFGIYAGAGRDLPILCVR